MTVIYLGVPSPARSSHPGDDRASLSCPHTGVAPDRVYSDGHFHEPSGELLPRLSTLTVPAEPIRRYISVALFLKSPSAGVTRYPCPVEPGLSSSAGFRLASATVQSTRRFIVQNPGENVNGKSRFAVISCQKRFYPKVYTAKAPSCRSPPCINSSVNSHRNACTAMYPQL